MTTADYRAVLRLEAVLILESKSGGFFLLIDLVCLFLTLSVLFRCREKFLGFVFIPQARASRRA